MSDWGQHVEQVWGLLVAVEPMARFAALMFVAWCSWSPTRSVRFGKVVKLRAVGERIRRLDGRDHAFFDAFEIRRRDGKVAAVITRTGCGTWNIDHGEAGPVPIVASSSRRVGDKTFDAYYEIPFMCKAVGVLNDKGDSGE